MRSWHGGWALPYNDSVKGRVMAGGMARTDNARERDFLQRSRQALTRA